MMVACEGVAALATIAAGGIIARAAAAPHRRGAIRWGIVRKVPVRATLPAMKLAML